MGGKRAGTAALAGAFSVAVVAVAAWTVPAFSGGDGGNEAVTAQDAPAQERAAGNRPGPGMRSVGYGSAAIDVPAGWATNGHVCGTPTEDTVMIDLGGVRACGVPRKAGIDSVGVRRTHPGDGPARGEAIEIDGVAAVREPTTCEADPFDGARTCRGSITVPGHRVTFAVASSTSGAEVDRILSRVRVLPDGAGVPPVWDLADDGRPAGRADYLAALAEAGLTAEVRTTFVRMRETGEVVEVSPRPGTMRSRGDVVTVTVAEGPRSAADSVVASFAYGAEGEDERHLTDEQIRANPTVTVDVGDRLRAYVKADTPVSGALEGTSVRPDRARYHQPAWRAAAPGRTRIILSVPGDDGTPAVIGVVTVEVRG